LIVAMLAEHTRTAHGSIRQVDLTRFGQRLVGMGTSTKQRATQSLALLQGAVARPAEHEGDPTPSKTSDSVKHKASSVAPSVNCADVADSTKSDKTPPLEVV